MTDLERVEYLDDEMVDLRVECLAEQRVVRVVVHWVELLVDSMEIDLVALSVEYLVALKVSMMAGLSERYWVVMTEIEMVDLKDLC